MGETFGGVDPGETGPRAAAGQDSDAFLGNVCDAGGLGGGAAWADNNGDDFQRTARYGCEGLTMIQLEEAAASGETSMWSLEKLAEAATAMCHLRSADASGQDPAAVTCPLTPREEALMDTLATAAVRGYCISPSGPATPQRAWAVSQLLWACARGQYWAGPPQPPSGTWEAAAAVGGVVDPGGKEGGDGCPAGGGNGGAAAAAWPRPAELLSEGVPAAAAAAATPSGAWGDGECSTAVRSDGNGDSTTASQGPLAAREEAPVSADGAAGGVSAGDGRPTAWGGGRNGGGGGGTASTARRSWRRLAVGLFDILAADGCRLVAQLDSRSVALVWWALAKAAMAARSRTFPATSPAAAAVVAAVSGPLTAALDTRAAESLKLTDNAQLCALFYSCACSNRASQRLLNALGDELVTRLESSLILDVGGAGPQRGRFTTRELSCVSYSCGLLGLRNERLLDALSEYAASSPQLKWSASALSVLMYGIANVGHRDTRLMAWADIAVTAKPAHDFNLRNISFMLYNFHRLRWWPRRAAEHLLSAACLHPPDSIPIISVSTILMCMGSGRARDERALAHLCVALAQRPRSLLTAKDICVCLTALQRLHGENVLASQQPECLEALDHLAGAIVERGFSRVTPSCKAVPEFNHQEVSNAMFALGKLKYYSPAVLDALRDHAARSGLEGASAWDCTAILVGLAQLNYHDPEDVRRGNSRLGPAAARLSRQEDREYEPSGSRSSGADVDLVGLLADTVARRVRSAKSQDLANTLWALTILEGALTRYRSIVITLMEEVNRRGPAGRGPDGFNRDEQRQIWQVHRELSALPEPYAVVREDLVRLGRLGMSEADHTYSRVQASFQAVLVAMLDSGRFPELRDLIYEQELVPGGDQLMRIDVQAMVERPSPGGGTSMRRVAVEFDGPFHFMINEPYTGRIDGRTALRNRTLGRHLGEENVVNVSMAEWVAASREPTRGMPGRWRLLATKMGLRV